MKELLAHIITVFLGFFAIMNPLANTPVFLGLVGDADQAERRAIARKALWTSFWVICAFSLLGKIIFELFGITLPAFRVAGGALVALVGYQMMHGEQAKSQQVGKMHVDDGIAISPLAVPILAGPGTIASAVNYSASANLWESAVVAVIFGVLCVVTYAFFMAGERILALIGRNGISIVTRLMGMILTVIGVQLLLEGIQGAFDLSGFQ